MAESIVPRLAHHLTGPAMPTTHIFCSVIDNFGDLGVCWRLARQLAAEFSAEVTLLVDDLAAFAVLEPSIDPALSVQPLSGITLMAWQRGAALALSPAALVIEGFACTLPATYRAQITAQTVWINLDYLSAEPWIDDCNGLSSPQAHGTSTTFWFPGFSARSGGLLREAGLIENLQSHDGFSLDSPMRISLFCYETESVQALLKALYTSPCELLICSGKALDAINAHVSLGVGERVQHGASTLQALPMLSHDDFDALLASCDLNIIRGEDSFVRAQWAGKPLLWHIYPQDELAHETKLAAWLARVTTHANPSMHSVMPLEATQETRALSIWQAAQWAWVRGTLTPDHLHALLAELEPLNEIFSDWRDALAKTPDLATQLMRFYANQVESSPEKTHTGHTQL